MRESTIRRTQTAFLFPKDKQCNFFNMQLKSSTDESFSKKAQNNKENLTPCNARLLFVPAIKARSTDRFQENERLARTKFKDFMKQINFFNIKQAQLEKRAPEDCLKAKKILMVSGITPESLKISRKSLNARRPSTKEDDKPDVTFELKLKSYQQIMQRVWTMNGMVRGMPCGYKEPLRATVKPGNNAKLVKCVIRRRWWWVVEDDTGHTSFLWSQLKDKNLFANRPDAAHNHLECNTALGSKKSLYYNMKAYYGSIGQDVFKYLPLTFHVGSAKDQAYQEFLGYVRSQEQKGVKNVWILKPGQFTNRGKGITIHSEVSEISAILDSNELHPDGRPKTHIIQIYLQRPFLYNRRKFDIRCYMVFAVLNNSVKGYWYQHGYIRTSSSEFQLGNFDPNIHLTNDAIQKYSQSYGKYEAGNKLSYYEFQKYLDIKYKGKYNFNDIYVQMKAMARAAMFATYKVICGGRRHGLFQIFGMDFMIDQSFKPWLIQINTNPCLQTSCPVLERIIPNLLQDTFKLCLDPLFPPPSDWPSSKKHEIDCSAPSRLELIFDELDPEGLKSEPSCSSTPKHIPI